MVWVARQAELESGLRHSPGVVDACEVIAEAVCAEARDIMLREAYDSGRLVAGVHVGRDGAGRVVARSSEKHAAPVEGGTGLYGPHARMIRARPGHPFVFRTRLAPRIAGSLTRTQSSILGGVLRKLVLTEHRGMPGVHPMERAGRAVAAQSRGLRWHSGPWSLTS